MRNVVLTSVLSLLALAIPSYAQEREVKIIITIKIEVVPPGPGPGPSPLPPTPTPPVPPFPPGPTPPTPPIPVPDQEAPIPAAGLHVLFLYESGKTLTREQNYIIFSAPIREYLNRKCPPGPNGRTKQWRMWDQNVNGADDSPLWDAAKKRADGKQIPWLIISNGRTGYEGPWPSTAEATLALLKKYGGD